MIVSCQGSEEMVKALLEHPKIDISLKYEGLTAEDLAMRCDHPEIAKLLKAFSKR